MKKLLLIISFLYSIMCSAQIVKDGEAFSDVTTFDGKVVFLKELKLNAGDSEKNYKVLKEWGRENFSKDPFVSSVRYDARNKEIIAKSRIELLLPPNAKNVREKVVMRYRLNAFIFQDKCVLEVKDISYMYNSTTEKSAQKIFRAEEMITNQVLEEQGALNELRLNTKKSTLYFLNELLDGLAAVIKN